MELDSNVNLVVCQKSKVDDWIEHFRKYYLKYNDKVLNQTFNLTNKAEFTQFFYAMNMTKFGQTIGVINYDLIFRRPELAKLKDFTLMLDESSLVQNEMSKRSKFILNKLNPTNVILLSGTPTGGKYERLWSQCKLLGWKISKDAFWKTYVDYHYDDKDGFPLKVIDGYKNVERLKRKFREHGAIFMKSEEVFDLPAQCNNNIFVSTTKEYRKFRKDSIVKFNDHEFVGDSVLTKMLYERMLCGFANDQKLDALQDLFDSTDDRIIIFYNFQNELRVLSELVYDNERPLSIINGDTKDLSAYDNSEDSVTLIQYQAGAMGLNLQKANKIIYFTPPLSSELFEQSKKRIHRIGQERSCFYYYLTCKGSIEEKIYRTLAMRKDYTDKLFERGE
jgi:SNF2 family DNA or RNA helicase